MSTRPLKNLHLTPSRNHHLLLFVFAAMFMALGCITLYRAPYPTSLTLQHLLILMAGWSICWGGTLFFLRKRLDSFDPFIVPVIALLTGWGLLLQARLAPSFMLRQVVWLFVGCLALTVIACLPTMIRLLKRYRYSLLTAGLILLSATLVFGVNPSGYGQRLWLGAMGVYIQPSEVLKLLLVIYLAAYLADHRHYLSEPTGKTPVWLIVIGPMLVMVGLALVLVGWQQDLGAALLFYLTFTAMLYLAWGKLWHVVLSLIMFVPVAIAGYLMSSRVALRVSIWLDPWAPEQADRAFQILQSLYAFSSGGIVGQGLGQGLPSLIPAVHTDFIYAAIAEEFGLLGAIVCIILFAIIIYRGIWIAQHTNSPFAAMLSGGIVALLAIQAWVIIAGNIKLLPITGVTLPFISYGGSSLVTVLLATGLLINISAPHTTDLSIAPAVNQSGLVHSAGNLGKALMVLLLTVIVYTGQWSVLRADELRVSTRNPRFVLSEARIQRGKIYDRGEEILATNEIDADGYVTRVYPIPEAAPAVGYATLAYGAQEIEAVCNTRLRGELDLTAWDRIWMGMQHQSLIGRDVRLTLDAQLQQKAQSLLEGYTGAAVLIDAQNGDILALASSPTYDPNTLQNDWDNLIAETATIPLLNRATQGLAQPGSILQTIILASILEQDGALPEISEPNSIYPINGTNLMCSSQIPTDSPDWTSVLAADCPGPFAALSGDTMSLTSFTAALETWGLLQAPDIELPTVAAEWDSDDIDLEREVLGQGNLLVTPLQMASVAATIANNGTTPPLHILMDEQTGCKTFMGDTPGHHVLSTSDTDTIRSTWHAYGEQLGDTGLSIAGEDRTQVWFIGIGPTSTSRYAVAVFIDNHNDPVTASSIGVTLLHYSNQH